MEVDASGLKKGRNGSPEYSRSLENRRNMEGYKTTEYYEFTCVRSDRLEIKPKKTS